ncbi:hypothetical protein DENIS_1411 [Desulfonema ishimotonii]|uniref:Uncharacterized protein n=1 Tax=Desulfonema ishimotonii TaxID=45657 RepID=A0A401FU42_9BACT|nr:hypothetical protein [Desulfonema ishimotonii]GBC60458.1 hypothetical protein DENIS_1411 [Desulfonema ishimotonii]
MADFRERIKSFAQDLTHLEVNTIVKANMTGRKMPMPRHALIEIAKLYAARLTGMGYPIPGDDKAPVGCYAAYDRIRERADEAVKALLRKSEKEVLTEAEEAELVMFYRIKTMSDQIKGVFNALKKRKVEAWDNPYTHEEIEQQQPPMPLEPGELVLIRKIWEMGLEQIAMQTIIQLDGDVVTRIQPRYANEESAIIHRIHNQSVSMSIDIWGQLISVVKDFFQTLFKKS